MNRAQRRAAENSNRRQTKSKVGLSVLAATSLVSGSTALLTALPAHAVTCIVSGGSNADLWNEMQGHLDNNSCDVIQIDQSIVLNTNDDDSLDHGYGPWYVDRNVTVVGNGDITLDADYESNIFHIKGGNTDVTLTLRNLNLIEGDADDGTEWSYSDNGGAIVQETSTDGEFHLQLDSVAFYDNFADSRGGAVFIDRGRISIIDGGNAVFGDSESDRGNGAYVHGGAVYIENGDFLVNADTRLYVDGNGTYGDGGGINLEFGDFRVYGDVVFADNYANQNGGGLHIDNGSVFADFDGEGYFVFDDNYAGQNGGGIYLNSGTMDFTGTASTLGPEFQGVLFVDNYADSEGGAIYVNSATSPVTFDNMRSYFGNVMGPGPAVGPMVPPSNGNGAEGDGGAIFIGDGDLEFTNQSVGIFIDNYTDLDRGGAIYLGNGDVNFVDSEGFLVNNEAEYDDGGAIFVSTGDVNIDSDSVVDFAYNDAENGGAVYIQSGDFISTGSVEFYRNRAFDYDYILSLTESEVGAAYVENLSGGAIFISEGNIDISGASEFTENYAERDGGAIAVQYVNDHVRLDGTVFTSNDAESDGGAIHIGNAGSDEITVVDAVFYQNDAEGDDGGAISVDYFESGTLTITGSRFKQNTAGDYYYGDVGGSIFFSQADNADITISSSTFMENYAGAQGGAIRFDDVEYGTLTISSTSFVSNESRDGGAISIGEVEYSDVSISNSTFNLNTTHIYDGRDGGAIHINDIEYGSLNITSSTFTNNDSEDEGGAIHIQHSHDANIQIVTSTFRDNFADNDGGAVSVKESDDSVITVSGSTFTSNYADDDGGAIYFEDGDRADINITNSVFTSNEAGSDGGAIHFDTDGDNMDVYITGSTFTSNKALFDDGGAVSVDGDSSDIYISNSTFISNSAGEQGGAIYFDSSSSDIYIEDSVFRMNASDMAPEFAMSGEEPDDEESEDAKIGGSLTIADHNYGGGAIFAYNSSTDIILYGGNIFEDNDANSGPGGAIYAEGDIFSVGQNVFINNRSDSSGGAIAADRAIIRDSYFGGNIAGVDGGAIWANTVDVVNNTFFNNQAGSEGGAIWATANLGEGDAVISKAAMNTFLVNLTGNESASVGLSIYTAGKINLFGNIFASNDSKQAHLEVGGGEGTPEFVDLGANFFTSSNDTDVLVSASSQLVSFADLTIPQEVKLDTTGVARTFVVPLTTDSLAADAIDTTEFAATLAALNLSGLNTDQRGLPRSGKYDAGAFEVGDSTYRKPQVDQQADQVVIAPKVVLPSSPASVSIKAEGRRAIRINWTAPKTSGTGKVLNYEIYRNGKKIATVSSSARTFIDRNLDSNQSYSYRILTVGSQGKSIKTPNTKAIFPRR